MAERTEDLNLPLSVVTRLIKEALPPGVNVSKEARVAIARAASVFVLYATATANNYTLKSKRRTLAAMDVIEAMKDMEFESIVETLKSALATFRDQQPVKGKRQSKAQLQQEQDEGQIASPPKRTAYATGPTDPADESDYEDVAEEAADEEAPHDEGVLGEDDLNMNEEQDDTQDDDYGENE